MKICVLVQYIFSNTVLYVHCVGQTVLNFHSDNQKHDLIQKPVSRAQRSASVSPPRRLLTLGEPSLRVHIRPYLKAFIFKCEFVCRRPALSVLTNVPLSLNMNEHWLITIQKRKAKHPSMIVNRISVATTTQMYEEPYVKYITSVLLPRSSLVSDDAVRSMRVEGTGGIIDQTIFPISHNHINQINETCSQVIGCQANY